MADGSARPAPPTRLRRLKRLLGTIRRLDGPARAPYLRALFDRLRGASAYRLPDPIRSVVFLCHGNIMRSAAGDQLLRGALHARGVEGIAISSAGMHAKNGREAMPQVVRAVTAYGASLVGHGATRATPELLRAADVVFAMDRVNLAEARVMAPDRAERIVLFGGVADGAYVGEEIPDPYGFDDAVVEATIRVVHENVERLADALAARARR